MTLVVTLAATAPGCDSTRSHSHEAGKAAPVLTGAIDGVAQWTVRDTPTVVLGAPGASTGPDFGYVDGAIALSTGELAVADMQSHNIRVFSPSGDLLRTLGAAGEGPGEFGYQFSIALAPGDTITAFDLGTHRVSWFTRDGFVRSVRFASARGAHPEVYGPFADGAILQVEKATARAPVAPGPVLDSVVLVLYGPSGGVVDTVGVFPGTDHVIGTNRSRGVPTRITEVPVFGRRNYVAPSTDRFAVARNDSMKFDIFSSAGTLIRTVRSEMNPRNVTASDIANYDKAVTDPGMPASLRTGIDQVRHSVPAMKTLPAFSQILFDSKQNLWVGAYALPRQAPRAFVVFDTAGAMVARVTLPNVERVLFIGDQFLLALVKDQDDIPMVARFDILR